VIARRRTKGTPSKLTSDVKEAVLRAFNGAGGAAYLERVAQENPVAFLTLLGRLVPREIALGITPDLSLRR